MEVENTNTQRQESKFRKFIRRVNDFDALTKLRVSEDSPIRRNWWYKYRVDTLSNGTLGFAVFGANELFYAKLSGNQFVKSRLIGAVVAATTARPYTMYRDFCFDKIFKIDENTSAWKKFIADTIVAESFWVPIYAASIALTGADKNHVATATVGCAVIDLFYGRPLGIWTDFVRKLSGVRYDKNVGLQLTENLQEE